MGTDRPPVTSSSPPDRDRTILREALGLVADLGLVLDSDNQVIWRERFAAGLGVGDRDDFLTRLHPDDLPLVLAGIAEARDRPGEPVVRQLRVRHPTQVGQYLEWEVRVRDHGPASPVGGLLAVARIVDSGATDLTGFETLAEAAPVGILVIGLRNTVTFANARAKALTASDDRDLVEQLDLGDPAGWALDEARDHLVCLKRPKNVWLALRVVPHTADGVVAAGWIVSMIDVTELVRARQAEAEARDAAVLANRAKSEFLAQMSHELRTPLNGVIGFAGLLQRDLANHLTPTEREYADRIRTSGMHMLALVDDLLDVARVESGELESRVSRVSLGALVSEVVASVQDAADRTGTATQIESDGPDIHVHTDPRRLRQILLNLVGNAVKFSPQGHVTVRIDRDEGGARISVRDDGIGIPGDRLDDIFAPFTQVDSGPSRRFGGAGLGLAISVALADQLGMTLGVSSQEGRGATFTLGVPPMAPGATPPSSADPDGSSEPS